MAAPAGRLNSAWPLPR